MIMVSAISAATLTTYIHDKAGFLLATGASQATNAYNGAGGVSSYNAPGAFGTIAFVTLSSSLYFNQDWTTALPGYDLAISDKESFQVTLPVLAYAFGLDVYDSVGDQSTFTVTLLNNTTTVGSFTFNVPDNVASFVGVFSDTAFNKVQVVETVGDATNDYFGMLYLTTTPVPEPATLFLMALAMLFLARKKLSVR